MTPSSKYRPLLPLEKALLDAGFIEIAGGASQSGGPMEPRWRFTGFTPLIECGSYAITRPPDTSQSGLAYCRLPPGHDGLHIGNVGGKPNWTELEWS